MKTMLHRCSSRERERENRSSITVCVTFDLNEQITSYFLRLAAAAATSTCRCIYAIDVKRILLNDFDKARHDREGNAIVLFEEEIGDVHLGFIDAHKTIIERHEQPSSSVASNVADRTSLPHPRLSQASRDSRFSTRCMCTSECHHRHVSPLPGKP